jgi:hypothetical protein
MHEDLAGERVSPDVQVSYRSGQLERIVTTGHASEQTAQRFKVIIIRGEMHRATLRNRSKLGCPTGIR